jgi:AraC-like DNA-binding protein
VELLGRYSRFGPLPRFTLESCTGRRTDHSGTVRPSKRHKISQRLTDEERSALIEAYANGASSDKVMQQFGISKSAVLSILDQAGVTRRVQTPTHEQLSEAERLYVEERWSLKRIGQHLGFGDTTIHRHLKLRGVQTRHPWERR